MQQKSSITLYYSMLQDQKIKQREASVKTFPAIQSKHK